ncbi:MAG: HEAT repeat domain-containing protein, partial [Planctomycetia bacterium]|nr:HEAT repeat domain-containing protein [Planctomycetia bacterium]
MACRSICVPLMLGAVLAVTSPGRAGPPSPIERYRNLKHPPTFENFNKGWEERVLVEFDIVNSAELTALRAGLKDDDRFVRSIAARALGIRGDKDSAEALAELVKSDPECIVRARAVESLGLLKMMPEVIDLAKKDSTTEVQWVARMAAGELKSEIDSRELMQQAYAVGIKADKLGVAKVGQPAPDFSAHTSDGKPFKLSSVVGKKPILLYFA